MSAPFAPQAQIRIALSKAAKECKPEAFLKPDEEKLENTAKSILPTPTPFKNITDK